jgi:hypothetical protein
MLDLSWDQAAPWHSPFYGEEFMGWAGSIGARWEEVRMETQKLLAPCGVPQFSPRKWHPNHNTEIAYVPAWVNWVLHTHVALKLDSFPVFAAGAAGAVDGSFDLRAVVIAAHYLGGRTAVQDLVRGLAAANYAKPWRMLLA